MIENIGKNVVPPQFYYKKSRIQQLKGFCYTVQEGTSLKASERMGLSASTITMQIKSLEEDLGIKLFERLASHRLKITPEGELLYKKTVPLIQGIDGLFQEFLQDNKDTKLNRIDIISHHIVTSHILSKHINDFVGEYPNNNITINHLPKQEAIQNLIEGNCDFIFYPFDASEKISPELELIEISDYKPVLIMNRNHPLANVEAENIKIKDLAKYKFLSLDRLVVFNSFKEMMNNYKISSNINLMNGNWEILKKFASENVGITIFSKIYLDKMDLETIIYKPISHIFPKMFYGILTRKGVEIRKNTKTLIELIINNQDNN